MSRLNFAVYQCIGGILGIYLVLINDVYFVFDWSALRKIMC